MISHADLPNMFPSQVYIKMLLCFFLTISSLIRGDYKCRKSERRDYIADIVQVYVDFMKGKLRT